MKKTLILVLVLALLTAAVLSGCGKNAAPAEETQPAAATQQASATQQATASPAPSASQTPAASQAPAGDDAYYSAVTSLGKQDVEAFAAKAKQAALNEDWQTLSAMMRYPATVGGTTVNSAEEFLSFTGGKHFSDADLAALKNETCTDMFFNGQGICLGDGEIWIIDVSYMTDNAPQLMIITINGIA